MDDKQDYKQATGTAVALKLHKLQKGKKFLSEINRNTYE